MPNRVVGNDTEGFGMVYIEAAACGKASLAGKAGGTGAAVLDGITGLRIDGASLNEVVAALEKLLTDEQLSRELGANGCDRSKRNFSWERVAQRTMDLDASLRRGCAVPKE